MVAAALTNALANNSRLRELCLSCNPGVTLKGWVGFSAVLRNPNTVLEKLDLRFNHINDHVITTFADALANNNMLRELNLHLDVVMNYLLQHVVLSLHHHDEDVVQRSNPREMYRF